MNDQLGDTPVAIFWGGDTADALDAPPIADGQAIGSGLAFDRRVGEPNSHFESAGGDLFVDVETVEHVEPSGPGHRRTPRG